MVEKKRRVKYVGKKPLLITNIKGSAVSYVVGIRAYVTANTTNESVYYITRVCSIKYMEIRDYRSR